ncbi:MAG: DUF58 domain-containing protein [Terriglobales bacterium]
MNEHHLLPPPLTAEARRAGRLKFGCGRRLLLLFALGMLWVVPAFWIRSFLYLLIAWDAVLLLGWLLDLVRLPRSGELVVERSWAGVPAIGCESQVILKLTNRSARALDCRMEDDPPAALRPSAGPVVKLVVAAKRSAVGHYQLRAVERGDHRIGHVHLRVRSMFDLAERWYRAPLAQEIRIYPNLEAAKRNTIYLMRSRQIEMEKRRLRLRGMGREFDSLREYQEQDDFRDICWTATARRGKLVTKVYTIERSQPVWIVLDTGRLLRTRVGALSKLDYAADAALSLAQLALYSGDRVGLLAYGRRIKQRVPLGRGNVHLRQIVEALAVVDVEIPEADHLRAAGTLLALQKRRGLVVWLTDLAETAMTPEVIEGASQMLARNLLLFVVIGQPELRDKAAERPESATAMYEMVAAQEMVQRRELLLARLRDQGALAMEVMPAQLSTALLNQYLAIKERSLV